MKTLLILLVLLQISNCGVNSPSKLNYEWQVAGIQKESNLYEEVKEEYLLTLSHDNHYTLVLDVNRCFGEYTTDDDRITFTHPGCTRICCDSDFALGILDILTGVEKFSMANDTLVLSGKDRIWLVKK